jgi:RHS repeat-associated protein
MLNQAGKVTSYTYNVAGERTSMTAPAGVTNYNYDSIGRLISLVNPHGETTTFTYDGLSRLTSKLLSSGTREEYTYDTLDRLQTMLTRNSSGSVTHSQSYSYNAASEVLSHTIDSEVINYGYDAASQLISEVRPGYSASYSYDGNGNRLTRTVNGLTEHYSYDDGDKMLSAGTLQFTYDAAGRRTAKRNHFGSVLQSYAYDDEDRLTTKGPQTYQYNGYGTRTRRTVGMNVEEFHRDGTGVTAPVIGEQTGGSLNSITPGISSKLGNGLSTFSHGASKDLNVQTNASELISATKKYDAYGNTLGSTGTWAGRYGYSGSFGYQDDGDSLQLLGHRYYDSSTGTFITRDPIKDGRNWYSYCENNPVQNIDPDGLLCITVPPGAMLNPLAGLIVATAAAVVGGAIWVSPYIKRIKEKIDEKARERDRVLPVPLPKEEDEIYFERYANGFESPNRLQNGAERANAGGFGFGVSVNQTNGPIRPGVTSGSMLRAAGFTFARTGNSQGHYTVYLLCERVDEEVARRFNACFGRFRPGLGPINGNTGGFDDRRFRI